jgi:hypothetical protein
MNEIRRDIDADHALHLELAEAQRDAARLAVMVYERDSIISAWRPYLKADQQSAVLGVAAVRRAVEEDRARRAVIDAFRAWRSGSGDSQAVEWESLLLADDDLRATEATPASPQDPL